MAEEDQEPFQDYPTYHRYKRSITRAANADLIHMANWREAYLRNPTPVTWSYYRAAIEQVDESSAQAYQVQMGGHLPDPRYPLEKAFWDKKLKSDIQ